VAPIWLVEGIIQRGNLYAVTALTNHGKTAICLLLGMCVASGRRFAGKDVSPGGVLILCGENPDGFRSRLRATLAAMTLLPADVAGRVTVLPFALPLRLHLDQIKTEATARGEFAMVLVDTSVSFFTGDNEDDNLQARDHACDLRELVELPGHPAVIVNCHPTKSADRETLLPRGGGAFLNEIDGNLTVWAEGETAIFHWHRKKRGPDFDPIPFEFYGTTTEECGIQVPTVVAWPISEERALELKRERRKNENRVLVAMFDNPEGTFRKWAAACQWNPENALSRMYRTMKKLEEYKLAEKRRGEWVLTSKGLSEAEKVR
jgi:hypothetical protein